MRGLQKVYNAKLLQWCLAGRTGSMEGGLWRSGKQRMYVLYSK